jgi:hypothetical protein
MLKENEGTLMDHFKKDIQDINNKRINATGSKEIRREAVFSDSSLTDDVEMNKSKSSNEKTPGYDGTIKTEAGDRYKANVEVPGNKTNTPPNQNTNPPKPNIGKGKVNRTTSGKFKTSTTNTYNPGTSSNTKPKTNTVKSARKNEAEASNSKLGTDTDKNMDVNGKGNTYERKTKSKFGVTTKQMGGYSDRVNSDYGQYTKANTSYNPEIKIGSVDYYKQFMRTGGNVSRFKQLDAERAKINKPKYQEGQKIKYQMGGTIKEGVVKSYNQDTGKVELYE